MSFGLNQPTRLYINIANIISFDIQVMQRLTIGNHLLSMPHSSFEIFQRYTSSRIRRVKLEDTRPGSTHHRFILGMLLLKCNHRKPKRSGKSFMKLKSPEPSYKEIEATYGRERQRAFRVEPIIWLQLEFLRLQYCDISTTSFIESYLLNKK